jgi:type VI secretion system protein VasJ
MCGDAVTDPAAPPIAADPAARAEAYLEPIPGPAPAGAQARYEPAYEEVIAEVSKVDAPSGGKVNWATVTRLAGELLRTKTKDLALAAYLAHALHATEGLEGLATGTELLTGLVERYWASMQPDVKRAKARANALRWFLERSHIALQAGPSSGAAAERVEAVEIAARRLAELTRRELGDASPAFGPFIEALERMKPAAPGPDPEPRTRALASAAPSAPTEAVAEASAPASAALAASVQPSAVRLASAPVALQLPSGQDPSGLLSRVGDALVDVAHALRAASAADPMAYRVLRVGLWLHVSSPPPAVAGRTSIPPIAGAFRGRLDALKQNGQLAAIVEETESALATQRFALDLNHATWQALRGLGALHERARAALVLELRGLLARLPELPGLSFADGTPLASPATRAWIDEVVVGRAPSAGAPADGALPAAAGEVKSLLDGTRTPEALAMMGKVLAAAGTTRERFLLRLELARACAAAGLPAVAKASYEELDREVRAHRLERWEPGLAAQALRGLIAASHALAKDARGASPQIAEVYQRLCSIDPAAAHEAWP